MQETTTSRKSLIKAIRTKSNVTQACLRQLKLMLEMWEFMPRAETLRRQRSRIACQSAMPTTQAKQPAVRSVSVPPGFRRRMHVTLAQLLGCPSVFRSTPLGLSIRHILSSQMLYIFNLHRSHKISGCAQIVRTRTRVLLHRLQLESIGTTISLQDPAAEVVSMRTFVGGPTQPATRAQSVQTQFRAV